MVGVGLLCSLMERLHLTSYGACRFDYDGQATPKGMQDIIKEISQSWWLERNPRDDKRQEIIAVDVTNRHSSSLQWGLEPVPKRILLSIWPQMDLESSNWMKGWHSFPLLDKLL